MVKTGNERMGRRLLWVGFWAAASLMSAIMTTNVYRELHQQHLLRAEKIRQTELLQRLTCELERMNDRLEFFKSDEGKSWIACEKLNIIGEEERIYSIARDVPYSPRMDSKPAKR